MAPLITNGDRHWIQWWSPLVPMAMGCSIGAITSITIGANGSPLAPFFVAIGANGANGENPKSLWHFCRCTYTVKFQLCSWKNCNLKHLLTGCVIALELGRKLIQLETRPSPLSDLKNNSENLRSKASRPEKNCRAVRSKDGSYKTLQKNLEGESRALYQRTGRLCMMKKKGFKQHITYTPQRPDIVVHFNNLKVVYMIELTGGDYFNFESQRACKRARYQQLLADICATGWKAQLFTVEVGCRGLCHCTLGPHRFYFFNIPRQRN